MHFHLERRAGLIHLCAMEPSVGWKYVNHSGIVPESVDVPRIVSVGRKILGEKEKKRKRYAYASRATGSLSRHHIDFNAKQCCVLSII
jgi:hypothetical protein